MNSNLSVREYWRNYREENKPRIRAYQREWARRKKAKIKEQDQAKKAEGTDNEI